MPTKALLHSAEVYELATKSADIGILGRDVGVDWARVQANRQSVSDRLTSGVAALMRANKIRVVDGKAEFTGPKTVKVGAETISADKVIIAVGSKPNMPPVPGLAESKAALDSTGALTLDHIPESLAVIGGGVIGLELGSVYMRFGTKVTVIEMLPRLLPLMDAELTGLVRAQLEAEGMEILTDASVVSVSDTASGAELKVKTASGERVIAAEKILVSTGRSPLTEGLASRRPASGWTRAISSRTSTWRQASRACTPSATATASSCWPTRPWPWARRPRRTPWAAAPSSTPRPARAAPTSAPSSPASDSPRRTASRAG